MLDAHLAEKRQSLGPIRPEHQRRQREDQKFEGGEKFDYYVDRKTGLRYYRARRQRLHLQHRSGNTHSGRRVGAHGIPHHLINGGDFGFLEWNSRESDGWCRQDTHSQDTSVQNSLITTRTAQLMRMAQDQA